MSFTSTTKLYKKYRKAGNGRSHRKITVLSILCERRQPTKSYLDLTLLSIVTLVLTNLIYKYSSVKFIEFNNEKRSYIVARKILSYAYTTVKKYLTIIKQNLDPGLLTDNCQVRKYLHEQDEIIEHIRTRTISYILLRVARKSQLFVLAT